MTLPRKPKEIGELEKLATREVEIGGFTLGTVPGGKYVKVPKTVNVERWYSGAAQFYPSGYKTTKHVALGSTQTTQTPAQREAAIKAGAYTGPVWDKAPEETARWQPFNLTHSYETYDWKLEDPHGATRTKLQEEEAKKAADVEEFAKQSEAWKRKGGGEAGQRPGTRSGNTILTGGKGVYGKPTTKKEKLGT